MSIKGRGKSGDEVSVLERHGYLIDGTFHRRNPYSVLHRNFSQTVRKGQSFFILLHGAASQACRRRLTRIKDERRSFNRRYKFYTQKGDRNENKKQLFLKNTRHFDGNYDGVHNDAECGICGCGGIGRSGSTYIYRKCNSSTVA